MNYGSYFKKIASIYKDMDRAYGEAAAHYDFDCRGCADNCCFTRFYHHTHVEFFYLLEGFGQLDPDTRERMVVSAVAVEKAACTSR